MPTQTYASSSSLEYADYTLVFSKETRSLFPNIEKVYENRELLLKVFTFDPESAQFVLETTNTVNRKAKPSAIEQYAASMEAGKWFPTHQGIAFGIAMIDGELRWVLFDGQNRLKALIEAGATQQFLVFFGFREGFQVMNSIDSGKNRSHGDALTILQKAGKISIKNASAAAQLLNAFYRGAKKQESRLSKLDLQGHAIAAHKALLFFEDELYKGISRKPKASISGALIRAYYSQPDYSDKYTPAEYRARLREFVEIMVGAEGSYLPSDVQVRDSYAYAFRKWLETTFPTVKQANDVAKRLRASMGGHVTSILYQVAERAIHNFLSENKFPGFAKHRKEASSSSEPTWENIAKGIDIESSSPNEIFTFPKGIANRAVAAARELVEDEVVD